MVPLKFASVFVVIYGVALHGFWNTNVEFKL